MLYRSPLVSLSEELSKRIPPQPNTLTNDDVMLVTAREWSSQLPFATIVLMANKTVDAELEKKAIVCYSEEWLYDWLAAPQTEGTYIVDGFKGLRKFYFHLQLKGWQLDFRAPAVDYHKIDLRGDSQLRYGNLPSQVKSCLNPRASREYLAKNKLANLSDAHLFVPSYITLDLSRPKFEIISGNVYIMKPIGEASGGAGVSVFSNAKEYRSALAKVRGKWKEVVICRYIDNPLLFRGRKFHLRCYVFASSTGAWSLFHNAEVITAALPYRKKDYSSELIHDTHQRSTDANYYFRRDFSDEDQERIWPAVQDIAKAVGTVPFSGYPEATASYDVLGLDVLVDENYHCWLLEVNFSPSMDPTAYDEHAFFEKAFFAWEVQLARSL